MRTLSLDMRRAMTAEQTGALPIWLLTVEHPDLPAPIRLSSDATARLSVEPLVYGTVSRGHEYLYVGLTAQVPEDRAEASPALTIGIEGASDQVRQILEATTAPAAATLELVMEAAPDVVEDAYGGFRVIAGSYDQAKGQITLGLPDLSVEPWPAGRFVPSYFPGLFR